MKKVRVLIILLLSIAVVAVVANAEKPESQDLSAGRYYSQAKQDVSADVAATYKDHEILMSSIEYMENTSFLRDEETKTAYGTEREIADRIIESIIMVEEAERRGLAATDEEIEEMVDMTRKVYEIPEGKELLDEYCEGAGITIEEYFEIIREQAPRTIARQKLRDAIGREFCEANGIEFTKSNPPAEIREAVDKYISGLLETHKEDIVYYVD